MNGVDKNFMESHGRKDTNRIPRGNFLFGFRETDPAALTDILIDYRTRVEKVIG